MSKKNKFKRAVKQLEGMLSLQMDLRTFVKSVAEAYQDCEGWDGLKEWRDPESVAAWSIGEDLSEDWPSISADIQDTIIDALAGSTLELDEEPEVAFEEMRDVLRECGVLGVSVIHL